VRWLGHVKRCNGFWMTARITIRKPDDWHRHVRDGEMLKAALPQPGERAIVYRGGETIERKVVSA